MIMLTVWHVLIWYHVDIFLSVGSLGFSNIHLPIFCILLRSWGSLGFLKICSIFLGGLKIIRILCLFNILPIRSVVSFTYRRMYRILLSDCVSEIVVLFACYIDCFDCVFFVMFVFCKASFKWLSSIRRCFLSEMVKALCELIETVFVLGDLACIYLCVLVFVLLRYRQLS